MSTTDRTVLRVDGLKAFYGNVEALHGVSIDVAAGELVAIIGPNGAGKTTLLKAVLGLVAAEGSVVFAGAVVNHWSTRRRARAGMVLVPEGRGILAPLTVRENLELGTYARRRQASAEELEADFETVFRLFPILKERLDQRAGQLSGGQQQMLAVGRAVMGRPRLLLLDEPSLGLAPLVTHEIFRTLDELNRQGLTILIVEQKAPLVLEMATRVYVLRSGRLLATAKQGELRSAEELAKLYLGIVD